MSNGEELVADNLRAFARDMETRATVLTCYPRLLQLEATNRCDRACLFCARNYWNPEQNPVGDLSPDFLNALRPFAARAEKVLIGGYGEPLLSETLIPVLDGLSGQRPFIEMVTNGVWLSDDRLAALLNRGVRSLVVSMDGVRDETLRRLRGVTLDQVQELFGRLRHARRREGAGASLSLAINFTAAVSNVSELPELVRLASAWGVSRIRVSHVRVFDSALVRESLFNDLRLARRMFAEARVSSSETGVELELPPAGDGSRVCRQPFHTMLIRWNGDVMGCCSAVFEGGRRFLIGNLRESPPWDLWNGERMREFRQAVYESRPLPAPCGMCCNRRATLQAQLHLLAHRPARQSPRGGAGGRRFILTGIDGADPRLLDRLIGLGDLPHMASLRGGGAVTRLRLTIHPNTPPAWVSMVTGVNPGKHGIYDFRQRLPGSYAYEFVDSRSLRAPSLWEILSRAGRRVGLVNVPMSYPVQPVNGFMIGGMHSPDLESAVYPPGLLEELGAVAPDYRIDLSGSGAEKARFAAACVAMAEARARAGLALYRRHAPGFFMIVFSAADRLQHLCWDEVEEFLEGRGGESSMIEALRSIYRICDRFVGELLEEGDDDQALCVVSDHGFGRLEKDVNLNVLLRAHGLQRLRTVRPASRSAGEGWVPPPGVCGEGFETVDWAHTRAYARGFFGNVFLNLEGREPLGAVRPADYEEELHRVSEALYSLRDPEGGAPVVDAVYPRRVLYRGPMTDAAPDLLVVMRNYGYMTRDGTEFRGNQLFRTPQSGHTGTHRLNGIFLASPGVEAGKGQSSRLDILDVAPAVLTWLGVPAPEGMDGAAGGDAGHESAGEKDRGVAQALSAEERTLLEARMRDLGYMV